MKGHRTRGSIFRCAVATLYLAAYLWGSVAVLAAQDHDSLTPDSHGERVPRVVYVELDGSQSDLMSVLAEMIYLQAAGREVLLRSPEQKTADSTLRVERDRDSAALRVVLLEHGTEVYHVRHELRGEEPSFTEMLEIINPTVEQLLPYLGPVERARGEAELTLRRRQAAAAESLAFEDRLATPWQFSLWFGELRQVFYVESPDGGSETEVETLAASPLFPFIVEIAHFRSQNLGLVGRVTLDYNSNTGFYDAVFDEGVDELDNDIYVSAWNKTRNIIVLPGIGIMYRSLGRLAMDFTLLYSLGIAHVTALEAVTVDKNDQSRDVLDEGESRVFLYQLLTLQPGLSYALNESWSLRAGLSFSLDPRVLVSGYGETPYGHEASLFLRWLQLGVARRF